VDTNKSAHDPNRQPSDSASGSAMVMESTMVMESAMVLGDLQMDCIQVQLPSLVDRLA